MGQYDQIARWSGKLDGPDLFGWVLGRLAPRPPLAFARWDDTRRLVSPGEPDRTNDLLAVLENLVQPERPVWMIVEAQEEPQKGMLYRMGQYELALGQEIAPLIDPNREPIVASLLLTLTGEQTPAALRWQLPGVSGGTQVAPLVVNFAAEDAAELVDGVAAGRVGPGMLPWVPLMRGGGEAGLIARWKQLAEQKVDAAKRANYRDAALVFAEKVREQVNWLRALEGWEMSESQYIKTFVLRGREEGVVIARRSDLLKAVRLRLQDPVPEPIRLAVEGTNDPDTLDRWFEVAITAGSLAELRSAMKVEG